MHLPFAAIEDRIRDAAGTLIANSPRAADLVARLNYCDDLTDDELTNDNARIVLDDRDALLAALKAIQANPNDPRAHRAALDVLGGR